jgi:surface protein
LIVRCKRKRKRFVSASFHSLWVFVAVLLYMVSKSVVEAVCKPSSKVDLKLAVKTCLDETRALADPQTEAVMSGENGGTGICPTFSAASNGAGCGDGGVNGVMGDWDITRVTILSNLFENKKNFRADISKWDTKRVVDMSYSTCASVAV